jgi:hypothetical protein
MEPASEMPFDNAGGQRFRNSANMPIPASPNRVRLSSLLFGGAALAATVFLGACDRHEAIEVPDSYGHGSSHADSYTDHRPDSRNGSTSFSDTTGTDGAKGAEPSASASPSPSTTPGSHFF